MERGLLRYRGKSGQNTTETIVLLPIFLMIVFGLLQMGQLGTALLIANYSASATARQMVQDNSSTADGTRFRKMLTAGMKNDQVDQEIVANGIFADVTVHTCAEIDAFPFFSHILGPALSHVGPGGSGNCRNISIFGYTTSPARFTVHGKATARMNYRP